MEKLKLRTSGKHGENLSLDWEGWHATGVRGIDENQGVTSLEKEHFEYYIEIDGEGRADEVKRQKQEVMEES